MKTKMPMPENSRMIDVSRITKAGHALDIKGDEELLSELVKATGVNAVREFAACLKVRPWKKNGYRIKGEISAEVEQACVATLEPLINRHKFDFERFFLSEKEASTLKETYLEGELILDPEADDFPDVLESKTIDLWDVFAEELNLNLEPFPRKTGMYEIHEPEDENDTHKPFASLDALINEKKSRN